MSDFKNKDYGDFFDSYDPHKMSQRKENYRPEHKTKAKPKRKIKYSRVFFLFVAIVLIVALISLLLSKCGKNKGREAYNTLLSSGTSSVVSENETVVLPQADDNTKYIQNIHSEFAVLVNATTHKVLAQKQMNDVVYPASMTKVMTALLAAEMVDDVTKTCEITAEMIDPYYKEGATLCGYTYGEKVQIIDLLYGALLESGADASSALAIFCSGSEEAFVEKMNERAKEMGLKSTNFTNPVGMHSNNHYTTVYEMAVIMQEAVKNPLIKKILQQEEIYKTNPTTEHPEGLEFKSTFMSRIYRDMAEGVYIEGGKTGYTAVSGHCCVSFATDDNENTLILVTAKSIGEKYYPIYDCDDIYTKYTYSDKEN